MKQQMILVAGPYRSGTDDIPECIQQNVDAMSEAALNLYRMSHLPVLGEWFALLLIETAGSKKMGDEIWNEQFHPVAIRLIDQCDAIFRIGGPSTCADEMVKIGKAKNKIIYNSITKISKA